MQEDEGAEARRRTAVERERGREREGERRRDEDRQGWQMNESTVALARERKSGRDIPGGAAKRSETPPRKEEGEDIAGRLVK